MENLSIAIQGFKIEIKIDQNFSPCLVCGTFLAFLAGLERATVELKLTRIARKRPEMLRTYQKQDKETR